MAKKPTDPPTSPSPVGQHVGEKEVVGSFAPPPADAPREVSKPLDPAALTAQAAKAAANERALNPLVFTGKPEPDPALAPRPPHPKTPAPAPASDPVPADAPTHQPAASPTDSPARGVPSPILDPHKQITGGWGDSTPQYFALTGEELRELVRSLFDRLNDQLSTDLRFGIACCYPQIRATVEIRIDGATDAAQINDAKFSLQEARVLTLTALDQESDDAPPDAIRDTLGLPKPQKTLLAGSTTARPMYADLPR